MLVRVSGPDQPGILAGLLEHLARGGAGVDDIEQITIRNMLNLTLVVRVPRGKDILRDLLLFGWEAKVDVDFEMVDDVPTTRPRGLVVTVLGSVVEPAELATLATTISQAGGNVLRIVRLAREPVMAYEFVVAGDDPTKLRDALLAAAQPMRCDVAVHTEGLGRRATRLIVMDVDSTLIQDEVIELLAAEAGHLDEVRAITDRAMAGELDFSESLTERVALLAGLDRAAVRRARTAMRLTPGAEVFTSTLRRLGYRSAIVSGGFTEFTDHLRDQLGIDHAFANRLEWDADGRLTGRVAGPVVDREAKADLLRQVAGSEGVPLDQVVAVGDGANDLDMLNAAGLGIAFNAKPVVADAADTTVTVPYLDAILFVLGVRSEDIAQP